MTQDQLRLRKAEYARAFREQKERDKVLKRYRHLPGLMVQLPHRDMMNLLIKCYRMAERELLKHQPYQPQSSSVPARPPAA